MQNGNFNRNSILSYSMNESLISENNRYERFQDEVNDITEVEAIVAYEQDVLLGEGTSRLEHMLMTIWDVREITSLDEEFIIAQEAISITNLIASVDAIKKVDISSEIDDNSDNTVFSDTFLATIYGELDEELRSQDVDIDEGEGYAYSDIEAVQESLFLDDDVYLIAKLESEANFEVDFLRESNSLFNNTPLTTM